MRHNLTNQRKGTDKIRFEGYLFIYLVSVRLFDMTGAHVKINVFLWFSNTQIMSNKDQSIVSSVLTKGRRNPSRLWQVLFLSHLDFFSLGSSGWTVVDTYHHHIENRPYFPVKSIGCRRLSSHALSPLVGVWLCRLPEAEAFLPINADGSDHEKFCSRECPLIWVQLDYPL